MNETIMRRFGYGDKLDLIKQGVCPSCKQPIGKFKDVLSRKEFGISGLCQMCQDKIFVDHDDDESDDYCNIDNPNGHPDRIGENKV